MNETHVLNSERLFMSLYAGEDSDCNALKETIEKGRGFSMLIPKIS